MTHPASTVPLHDKVNHALQSVEAFCSVLDKETAALQASDFPLFQSLHQEKMARARDYQESILAFEDVADLLAGLDEDTKNALHIAHRRFTESANANHTVLQSSVTVAERIVTVMMEAARRSVSEGPAYSASGKQDLSDKIPVHFKLNEVL